MKKFQLIGEKLAHSFSKDIHSAFGDYCYDLKELDRSELEGFVKTCELDGFNVTIPYKSVIIPYLDELDAVAKEVGAVNTVVMKAGQKIGYNTDVLGFEYLLDHAKIEVAGKKIIILGSGGTSHTVEWVLKKRNASQITIVSRTGEVNYSNIGEYNDCDVIINTTPCGMYPNNYENLIDLSDFYKVESVVDVICNPIMTKLLFEAKKRKINYTNGLPMLVAQAKFARDIYMGDVADNSIIDKILIEMRSKLANIVLIGMPGSGKTSVGEEIAKMLGRPFFDMDAEIVEKEGMSIMNIFGKKGENFFRAAEHQMMVELGLKNSCVIATGGGIVKTDGNDFAMQQNSFVVYIDRDLENLAREDRPLSKDKNALVEIFKERGSKYHTWSDFVVSNNKSIDACLKKILEKYDVCIREIK